MKLPFTKLFLIAMCLMFITLSHPVYSDTQDNSSATPVSVDWSRDCTKIAVGYSNGMIDILDAVTGQAIQSLTLSVSNVTLIMLAWNPVNCEQLAVSSSGGHLDIFDLTTGQSTAQVDIPNGGIGYIAWKPDGSLLAAAVQRGNHPAANYLIDAFNPLTGEYLASIGSDFETISAFSWSPDGTRMAQTTGDDNIMSWQPRTTQATSTPGITLQGHSQQISALSWNSSGTQLASGGLDGTLRIWDISSGAAINTFTYGCISEVQWRPNSDQVAFTIRNRLYIVDSVTGEALTTIELPGDIFFTSMESIAWNPDGSQLVYIGKSDASKVIEIIPAPDDTTTPTPVINTNACLEEPIG